MSRRRRGTSVPRSTRARCADRAGHAEPDARVRARTARSRSFALWDPAELGYLAAYAAAALASGQITGEQGDKFKAGKLGEYTIGAKGEVVLGPAHVFDAANIDKFNF